MSPWTPWRPLHGLGFFPWGITPVPGSLQLQKLHRGEAWLHQPWLGSSAELQPPLGLAEAGVVIDLCMHTYPQPCLSITLDHMWLLTVENRCSHYRIHMATI